MDRFPVNIKFKYNWRKYQESVLDKLDEYLQDGHLHVIAPPGSGKTVLGLEAMLRIDQPTLILTPTIAIRNQWVQKFCELFLQTDQLPDWISYDVRYPQFMTVITYQGLHAACANKKIVENDPENDIEDLDEATIVANDNNINKIITSLKAQRIKTIIVDESHHLKSEWWHTLIKIKKGLEPVVIGLTATPPYDVTANEWQRYIELNGPVDVEISVPELIIEGDLCPHQDHIYLSLPTSAETENIANFRNGIEKLFQEIKTDPILICAIQGHPIWADPQNNLDQIYANLPYYSACLIFLNADQIPVPKSHLAIIDDKEIKIPAFDHQWAEILLTFYLYKDPTCFKAFKDHQHSLENKLQRYGAIEKHHICFSKNQHITGALASSVSKLDSIKQITDLEYAQLENDLRLVILTDFIRKEYYEDIADNTFELNKIGVLSVFEKLRRNNPRGMKIGVLTGSVVIIPKTAYQTFRSKITALQLSYLICDPIPFDNNYLLVEESQQAKGHLVDIITQIFQKGEIEILIGTKSLLGEGWDAPCTNSLILASFVGSFVLSNQMRGRAIRTQRGNANKTGNIWHLCCVDPTTPQGGDDLEMLKRRFNSFVGISFKNGGGIENGISRMDLPQNLSAQTIATKNEKTFERASDRRSLKECWKSALEKGFTLTEEIKIPFGPGKQYHAIKNMYLNKTIKNLFAMLFFGLLDYLWSTVQALSRNARSIRSAQDLYTYLTVFGLIGVVIFGRLAFKAFRLFVRYRDIAKDIKHIAEALLQTLIKVGVVKTNSAELTIESSVDNFGAVSCHLAGGSTFERSNFINMLYEIISPVDNPRYVIIRKNIFMFFVKQKDFHSVPEYIGRNKAEASYFANQWKDTVGNCELVFTRTAAGRQIILRSRLRSLAAQFDNSAERVSKWM